MSRRAIAVAEPSCLIKGKSTDGLRIIALGSKVLLPARGWTCGSYLPAKSPLARNEAGTDRRYGGGAPFQRGASSRKIPLPSSYKRHPASRLPRDRATVALANG